MLRLYVNTMCGQLAKAFIWRKSSDGERSREGFQWNSSIRIKIRWNFSSDLSCKVVYVSLIVIIITNIK